MTAGADMVKIFLAALAGPKYMTNLKMVYPEVNLIPYRRGAIFSLWQRRKRPLTPCHSASDDFDGVG